MKALTNIKAVLFDIDGVLLDTREFIFQAYEHTFQHFNESSHPRDVLASWVGRPLEEAQAALSKSDPKQWVEVFRAFQDQNLRLSVPFEQTKQVLEQIVAQGIKTAAVTSRSNRSSVKTLELAAIDRYIDTVISKEDVTEHKPKPQPVLLALDRLNVKPQQAVMVGDAPSDIGAGQNAGTHTVGVTYGFGDESSLAAAKPDYLIHDLRELTELIK